MNSYFTVALTGGIASGKTTVLQLFEQLGINTLSADSIAHQLMSKEGAAYEPILQYFGDGILTQDKDIDRAKLRTILFNSPMQKQWLEQLIHPKVRDLLWKARQRLLSPYAVIEIPLLAESNRPYEWIDRVLLIDCDEVNQQKRAKQRSGLSYEQSRRIIEQQASRDQRKHIANDIITNDGDLRTLEIKVKALHNEYTRLSQR